MFLLHYVITLGNTKLFEGVQVQKIKCEGKRVTNVVTDHGNIRCNYFINSAGLVTNLYYILKFRNVQNTSKIHRHKIGSSFLRGLHTA